MPSERYDETEAQVEAAVRRVFPKAKPIEGWGGPTWAAPRPEGAPVANETGTYDPKHVVIGLADRKAGPTVYFLDPGDYFILDKHREALEEGGLKVMRGCLVHARKVPFPIAAVEALFRDVRDRDAAAAKKAGARKPAKAPAKKAAPRKPAVRKTAKNGAKKSAARGK